MPDDLSNPQIPTERNQAWLVKDYYNRLAEEERKVALREAEFLAKHGQSLKGEAESWGLTKKEDQERAAEEIARIAVKTGVERHQISESVFEAVTDKLREERYEKNLVEADRLETERKPEVEQREQAQREHEAKSAADRAEPLHGTMQRFDDALEQRQAEKPELRQEELERLNNADMERLATLRAGEPSLVRFEPLGKDLEASVQRKEQKATDALKASWAEAAHEVCSWNSRKTPPGDGSPSPSPTIPPGPSGPSSKVASARDIMNHSFERTDRQQESTAREIMDYKHEQSDRQHLKIMQDRQSIEPIHQQGRGGRTR